MVSINNIEKFINGINQHRFDMDNFNKYYDILSNYKQSGNPPNMLEYKNIVTSDLSPYEILRYDLEDELKDEAEIISILTGKIISWDGFENHFYRYIGTEYEYGNVEIDKIINEFIKKFNNFETEKLKSDALIIFGQKINISTSVKKHLISLIKNIIEGKIIIDKNTITEFVNNVNKSNDVAAKDFIKAFNDEKNIETAFNDYINKYNKYKYTNNNNIEYLVGIIKHLK